jgi:hypothetical protein
MVPVRAHAEGVSPGKPPGSTSSSSTYRFVGLWQSGRSAWHSAGSLGVVVQAVLSFVITAALSWWLRRIPTLLGSSPR